MFTGYATSASASLNKFVKENVVAFLEKKMSHGSLKRADVLNDDPKNSILEFRLYTTLATYHDVIVQVTIATRIRSIEIVAIATMA